jgi:hypothetical protein
MLLRLDDTYRITSVKRNLVLEKLEEVIDLKTKQPTGKSKWKTEAYFGHNLTHALNYYINSVTSDLDKVTAQELIAHYNRLRDHVSDVVKRENINFNFLSDKESKDE